MVESSAIAALESAAADLGKLLSGWTRDLLADSEAALDAPAESGSPSKRPDLSAINSGIQSLWRLVAVHKSIQQLKNPSTAPSPTRAPTEFRLGVQTSVCSGSSPVAPPPLSSAMTDSPALPTSVRPVPNVPSVPAYRSFEAIAAKADKLFAETAALMAKNGLPMPEPDPVVADQLKTKLLTAITSRATFPGSGNLLNSLRADLASSPP